MEGGTVAAGRWHDGEVFAAAGTLLVRLSPQWVWARTIADHGVRRRGFGAGPRWSAYRVIVGWTKREPEVAAFAGLALAWSMLTELGDDGP